MGGLRERQREALAQEHEAVEKAARQLHVVVEHQQPVVAVDRVRGQQQVQVLELAARVRRAGVKLDVVARAEQLDAHRRRQLVALGPLDSQREHPPQRRLAARGEVEPQAPAAEQLPRVDRRIERLAAHSVDAADRSTRAGEEVVWGSWSVVRVETVLAWNDSVRNVLARSVRDRLAGACRAFAQALAQPPPAVGGHREARRAAAAHDVPEAAGEREHLRVDRGRLVASSVEAPGGAPARVGGARECAQARVVACAAVLDGGAGNVQDPRAGLLHAQAFLPLLLVAAVLERHVERSHALQRVAADGHVRAPCIAGVGVALAQLERGDRRALPLARARRAAFEPCADRPGEDLDLRVLASGVEQRLQPAGAHADVVVDEHHALRASAARPCCARRSDPAEPDGARSGRRSAPPARVPYARVRRRRSRAPPPRAARPRARSRTARPPGRRGGRAWGSRSRLAGPWLPESLGLTQWAQQVPSFREGSRCPTLVLDVALDDVQGRAVAGHGTVRGRPEGCS